MSETQPFQPLQVDAGTASALAKDQLGICTTCGSMHHPVSSDSVYDPCFWCGQNTLAGMDVLLERGLVVIVSGVA